MHLNPSFLSWVAVPILLAGLSILIFVRLRTAQYESASSAFLTILTAAQPAYAIGTVGLRAACFALAAFTTAVAAAALLRRQDPRRIVLLGSSLAGAQLVHPMWSTAASVILPFALRRSLAGGSAGRLAGWYVSLLFIPALAAIALVYLSTVQNLSVPPWTVAHTVSGSAERTILCVATATLVIAPLLALHWQDAVPDARVVTMISAIVVATSVLLGALGQNQLLECAAAVGPLLILIVSGWPRSARRSLRAILFVGGNLVLSWGLVLGADLLHV